MKNKYITLCTISYIAAIIWFYSANESLLYHYPRSVIGLSILLILVGIILGVKSVNKKETGWIGRIDIIIGIILLLIFIFYLTLGLSSI